MNAAGNDYLLLSDGTPPCPPLLPTLQALLRASPEPLTRRDLLASWPAPAPRPDTLWRTLAHGLQLGLFVAGGAGTKTEPFGSGNQKAESY